LDLFYTVAEVANMLKIKKSYVYELIYSGRLNAFKISDRRTRIPKKSLNEYLGKECGCII